MLPSARRRPRIVAARSVGDDAAGVEQDRPRADLEHHLEVVRGDQLGAAQALKELDEPPAAAGVEVGGGLVEDEHRRLARQHAGQAGALALAEAEVMGRPIGLRLKLDPRQAFQCDASAPRPGSCPD